MHYTRTKLGKIKTPKTFCGTQSKNFHAKVWKVSLENTTTWKIKSSTSSVCQSNSPKLQCWKRARWSRNPVWPMEYTTMVQLWKMWKDINQLRLCVLSLNSGSSGISFRIKSKTLLDYSCSEIFCRGIKLCSKSFLRRVFLRNLWEIIP